MYEIFHNRQRPASIRMLMQLNITVLDALELYGFYNTITLENATIFFFKSLFMIIHKSQSLQTVMFVRYCWPSTSSHFPQNGCVEIV